MKDLRCLLRDIVGKTRKIDRRTHELVIVENLLVAFAQRMNVRTLSAECFKKGKRAAL